MTATAPTATLVVEPATVQPGRIGPATGAIWLEIGGEPFPVHGWNDFVVVVTGAFVRAALELLERSGGATVHFMDGPFAVELSVAGASTWTVRLIDSSGVRPRTKAEALIRARPFAASLVASAERLLAVCRDDAALWSSDAQALGRDLKALAAILDERRLS